MLPSFLSIKCPIKGAKCIFHDLYSIIPWLRYDETYTASSRDRDHPSIQPDLSQCVFQLHTKQLEIGWMKYLQIFQLKY